jgi:hypothetical protein
MLVQSSPIYMRFAVVLPLYQMGDFFLRCQMGDFFLGNFSYIPHALLGQKNYVY